MSENGDPRLHKSVRIVELARELAGSAEGLTLDEIGARMQVGRRTAERMRDALRDLFPGFKVLEEGRERRFRIVGGMDGFMAAPSADELAELVHVADQLEQMGAHPRAELLRALDGKIRSALRDAQKRLIAPDAEALARAQASTWRAGPHPVAESETLTILRAALKAMRIVSFTYRREDGASAARNVCPFGLLYGSSYYLVGAQAGKPEPVLWRLDRMTNVRMTDRPGAPPKEFSLWAYAARSFGTYQEEAQDVELLFSPDVAQAARGFLFHPAQNVRDNEDGSVTIAFRAGGFWELAWHLFTWGAEVTILAPDSLRDTMIEMLESAREHHMKSARQSLIASDCGGA